MATTTREEREFITTGLKAGMLNRSDGTLAIAMSKLTYKPPGECWNALMESKAIWNECAAAYARMHPLDLSFEDLNK